MLPTQWSMKSSPMGGTASDKASRVGATAAKPGKKTPVNVGERCTNVCTVSPYVAIVAVITPSTSTGSAMLRAPRSIAYAYTARASVTEKAMSFTPSP